MKPRRPSYEPSVDDDGFASVKPGPPPPPPPGARAAPKPPPREVAVDAVVVGGLCRVCGSYGEHYCPGCGQFYCDENHARVLKKHAEHHYRDHGRRPATT